MMQYLVAVFFLCNVVFSQGADTTCIIRGKVTDHISGEPLPGATIIYGINKGTSTGKDGVYFIKTLPGNITLSVQYVGYKSISVSFTLKANDTIYADFELFHAITELDQIVVSAGKAEQRVSELTVSVSIIRPDILSKSHITDAKELLNKTSGIEILDGQASIRGGSGFSYGAGSRVLALIDGLPVLATDAGNVKWQFMPLDNLSQVEIIKGASSVLYGSSALNGIINFRTADAVAGEPVTKFVAETGVFDNPRNKQWIWWDLPVTFSNISFSHLKKYGNTDVGVTATVLSDNGYRKLNDEKLGRMNVKLKHFNKNIPGLTYGMNLNAGYTEKRDFVLWENAYTGALKQDESTAMLLHGSFIAFDPFISMKKDFRSNHDLRMRLQLSDNTFPDNGQNDSHALSLFTEYLTRYRIMEILNLNIGFSQNLSKINSPFYGNHQGINLAGYSQVDVTPAERIKLVAGVRLEFNSLDGINDRLVPLFRTGINYKLLDLTFLRASFGQGYRYPSIAEKHASTTLSSVKIIPNHSIMPESGWNSEIGIKQGILTENLNGQVDIALFYLQNKDLIEYNFGSYPDPVTGISGLGFRAENVEQSRVYGGELEFLLHRSSGNFQNSLGGGYVYMYPVEFNPVTNKNTDVYLKYRRKHSGKLNLSSKYKRIEFSSSLYVKSKILNIDEVFVHEATRESLLPGFYDYWTHNNKGHFLMDISAGFNLLSDKYKISLAVKNLTNAEYMGRPGDIMPQRNFSIRFSGNL